jgi:tetratricopeptide (TPR) repeat protein
VEATDLARSVLRQLGREFPAVADSTDTIAAARKALNEECKLLVLDDVSDEGQVYELLPAYRSGTAMILVSQDALRGIPIPHIELDALPMPTAIQLLRTAAGDPPELEDPSVCEELVEIAAGLPLPIQLIGAQIAEGTSPAQLQRMLQDESTRRSFVDSRSGAPSMRSAIAATYDSLAEPEQALLRLLSLHSTNAFTEDDLIRELGLDGAPAVALQGLVRRYLLELDDGLYRMNPAVRRFAREQLSEEELDSLATRFVPSHLENPVLAQLRPEASVVPIAGQLSDHVEAQEYALRVATATGDRFGEAKALINLGALYRDRGHFADASAALEAALGAAEAAGDVGGAAEIRLNLGRVAHEMGRTEEAEAHVRKGLDALNFVDDPMGRATASLLLGDLLAASDRPREATPLYAAVFDSMPEESDIWVRSAGRLGYLAELDDDLVRARELYVAGLGAAAASDAERAKISLRLGMLELRHGKVQKAEDLFEQAFLLFRRAGAFEGAARCAVIRGILLLAGSEMSEAERSFQVAGDLAEEVVGSRLTALVAFGLALVHVKRESAAEAQPRLEEALAMFRENDDPLGEAHALVTLGGVLKAKKDPEADTVLELGKAKLAATDSPDVALPSALIGMALTAEPDLAG